MNKKVMIIEDDTDIREALVEALVMENYDVLQAENGFTALECLKNSTELPGCIIVDLMMPVMGGEQFLENVQTPEYSYLSKIPVIVASAKGNSHLDKTLNGAVKHIVKPVDLMELYEAVEKHYR